MTLLCWDKPEKILSTEEWKETSFDGGPPGGFVPNMSEQDNMKWKAKLTGQKLGFPQVEIRRGGMVCIVNLGKGYNYKFYRATKDPSRYSNQLTTGVNIHIATNGPIQWTFDELSQFNQAIEEAKEVLLEVENIG